jgi:hypothetical protein
LAASVPSLLKTGFAHCFGSAFMLLGALRSAFASYFTVKFWSMGFGSFFSAFSSCLSNGHLAFSFAFAQKLSPPKTASAFYQPLGRFLIFLALHETLKAMWLFWHSNIGRSFFFRNKV